MKILYLNNSLKNKILDAIRGTEQLKVASSKGWREWHAAAKAAHPIRYWITEVGFRSLRYAFEYIPNKLNELKHYIVNRYIFPTHVLQARSLKNGYYRDLSDKILPCLFESLVDFVEVELAYQMVDEDIEPAFSSVLRALGKWRRPDFGVYALQDRMRDVSDLSQGAVAASEVFELYMWYKNVYLLREDPADKSGWNAFCSDSVDSDGYSSDESSELIKRYTFYENEYHKEDSEMLTRLINVRTFLWT